MKALILLSTITVAAFFTCAGSQSTLPDGSKAKTCEGGFETGNCKAAIPRYYYDTESRTCKEFTYGGCGGNGNNYETEEECKANCADKCGENEHFNNCGTSCPLTCDNLNPPEICNLMCTSGCECRPGYVRSNNGTCVEPSNCLNPDNENKCGENERFNNCGTSCPLTCDNFLNPPENCNRMCKSGCECKSGYVRSNDGTCVAPFYCLIPINERSIPKTCDGGSETGICEAYMPRFYYDTDSRTCKIFIYGGCGGNGNNYETEAECMANCAGPIPKTCDGDPETGECKARMPRYYYDTESQTCKEFTYGGCGGNGNNYETEEGCMANCAA